jgi:hypothetical protein
LDRRCTRRTHDGTREEEEEAVLAEEMPERDESTNNRFGLKCVCA